MPRKRNPFGENNMPTETATPVAKTPKTYTNWKAFELAKIVPVTVSCEGYKPVHGADMSCHTKLPFKAEVLKKHYEGEHGGGFRFHTKVTDGKPSTFWQELMDAGLEAHDFRCENCDKQLRFHPSAIIPHLKAHGGKTRRVYPGGVFNVTLSLAKPENAILDEDESA